MLEKIQPFMGTIIYLLFFFALIYFLMIRPQQKQQKARQDMYSKMKINDPIVTIGGIHGRIVKMKDDIVTIRIADKVEIDIDKGAVGRVGGKNENEK